MLDIKEIVLNPIFFSAIQNLPQTGIVKTTANGFAYLDIDDRFIHRVYPLLDYPRLIKPDYFSDSSNYIGAHISIVYPEENVNILPREENKSIGFTITGLFMADILDKRYYAFKVHAPELLALRRSYRLSKKLQLKGYLLDPHITIANSLLSPK